MQVLPLSAIPNQQFSIILDSNQWNISVRDCNGAIAVTLIKNNEVIVSNARAVAGMRIIQSRYLEDGNFAIISNNQTVPDYTQFGIAQFMVYIGPDELNALDITPPAQITQSYFNALGGLPLRFSPQGYTLGNIKRGRAVKFRPRASLAAVH